MRLFLSDWSNKSNFVILRGKNIYVSSCCIRFDFIVHNVIFVSVRLLADWKRISRKTLYLALLQLVVHGSCFGPNHAATAFVPSTRLRPLLLPLHRVWIRRSFSAPNLAQQRPLRWACFIMLPKDKNRGSGCSSRSRVPEIRAYPVRLMFTCYE